MEEVFNALTQYIKNNNKILIMTHKNPDFDGMGAALVLQQIIFSFNKECYICQNSHEKNRALIKAYNYLTKKNINYKKINKTETLNYVDENTLLIILDVQIKSMLEEPKVFDKTKKVIVLDHHIKSQNSIRQTILTYINSNLSSVVEFMSSYVKYLNKRIDPLFATFMQVGLEIDTNNYKLKTTEQTFETAAFLTKIGADSIIKQELLKENKKEYLKKQKVIENSFMINKNMAMCLTDDKIYEQKDLASIAEALLQFENVEASFAIGKIANNEIGISARSIGTINVEYYMAKLGGGGHLNEAATQLKNVTLEEAKKNVIKVIGG